VSPEDAWLINPDEPGPPCLNSLRPVIRSTPRVFNKRGETVASIPLTTANKNRGTVPRSGSDWMSTVPRLGGTRLTPAGYDLDPSRFRRKASPRILGQNAGPPHEKSPALFSRAGLKRDPRRSFLNGSVLRCDRGLDPCSHPKSMDRSGPHGSPSNASHH
jgi:hypothetical protein